MTFAEQTQQAFDTLATRFREEIARELRQAAQDVVARADAERMSAVADASSRVRADVERTAADQLQRAVSEAEARGRDVADRAARGEFAKLEQRAQDSAKVAAAASREEMRAAALRAGERLVEAVRALDRARSLSEILDTLIGSAGREAPRVAVLLAPGGALRGWRFLGFGAAFESASPTIVPLDESGIIAEAVRTAALVRSDAARPSKPPRFAQLPTGRESLAVPLTISGDVVAVLYADCGGLEESERPPTPLLWSDTLELLARHAARCLEASTAVKAVQVLFGPQNGQLGAASADSNDRAQKSSHGPDGAPGYARILGQSAEA